MGLYKCKNNIFFVVIIDLVFRLVVIAIQRQFREIETIANIYNSATNITFYKYKSKSFCTFCANG